MDESRLYTIKQASEEIGVPSWVVRRLCRNGLIPHVRRNRSGYQMLTMEQVTFAQTLIALEKAGMTRSKVKRFSRLFRRGDESLAERKAMLETQRRQFWQELEDRQHGIDAIERQIEIIDTKLHTET